MDLPNKITMIRLSTGRDVPRDVPGQTGTGRPAVPLSRDKDIFLVPLSLCPGTTTPALVPGQTLLSRDVPGQNHFLFCTLIADNCIFFNLLVVVAISQIFFLLLQSAWAFISMHTYWVASSLLLWVELPCSRRNKLPICLLATHKSIKNKV